MSNIKRDLAAGLRRAERDLAKNSDYAVAYDLLKEAVLACIFGKKK